MHPGPRLPTQARGHALQGLTPPPTSPRNPSTPAVWQAVGWMPGGLSKSATLRGAPCASRSGESSASEESYRRQALSRISGCMAQGCVVWVSCWRRASCCMRASIAWRIVDS